MGEGAISDHNVFKLKNAFAEAAEKFFLAHADLDTSEVVFACLTFVGSIISNVENSDRRQCIIKDVERFFPKMLRAADDIAAGRDPEPVEYLN